MADMQEGMFMQSHQEYIQKKVNPVLESMVTQVLLERPDDLVPFMIKWLSDQAGLPPTASSAEFEELQKELAFWESRVKDLESRVVSVPKDMDAKAEDEDEDDDDDDDDDAEMPPPPPNYQSKGQRSSVSAEAYGAWNQMTDAESYKAPDYPKTPEQRARIAKTLEQCFLFAALDDKELQIVIGAMVEKQVDVGQQIIREGDDGDVLYVVEEGQMECFKNINGEEKSVKVVQGGDAFGELALLYSCPRAASVFVKEKAILWQLDRETFNHIVKSGSAKKRQKYESFLASVSLLEGMEPYERSKVADALRTEKFKAGECIVSQGDPGDKFFIVEEGEAIVTKAFVQGQIPQEVMQYKAGDYFGELALLHNEPRAANVFAKSEVRCLVLDRRSFKRLLGPLEDILRRNTQKYQTTA